MGWLVLLKGDIFDFNFIFCLTVSLSIYTPTNFFLFFYKSNTEIYFTEAEMCEEATYSVKWRKLMKCLLAPFSLMDTI